MQPTKLDLMQLPDYKGSSIVNLMASISAVCGCEENLYPTLHLLPPSSLSGVKHLVLVVIDGLGYDYLIRSYDASTLRRYLKGRMTSVFPSTTASAITTFLTGLAPQQHALPGWFTYFGEIDRVAIVLPFTDRYGGKSLTVSGIDPARLLKHRPIFDRIETPSYIVVPQRIAHSAFNLFHSGSATIRPYTSLKQFFRAIDKILRDNKPPTFVYAYWPELDHIAHEHGIESQAAARHLAALDVAFKQFLTNIAGAATLLITADHGIIDSGPNLQIELDQHPRLQETLVRPLCGERRAAYCYVHPTKRMQFESYIRAELADSITLCESTDLIEHGFFGLGEPHPRLKDRIGDYTMLMKQNYVIKDWVPGEKRFTNIGAHGGVSHQEMAVPLIMIET